MSNTGNSEKWEAIREIAASAITTSFQTLGGVLTRDSFRYVMTNNTNGDIYLSLDGVTDQKKFPANSARILDDKSDDMFFRTGTQVWIRYDTAPGIPTGWFGFEVEYV